VEALAIGQADIGFAPVAAATGAELEGLFLALHINQIHGLDLDAEELLYGSLHVGLGRRLGHFEHVLVRQLLLARTLLGDVRRAQDAQDLFAAHDSHSSIFLIASTVTTT
jgi:hypothetical protein